MYVKYMALSTKPAAKCWKCVWVFFIRTIVPYFINFCNIRAEGLGTGTMPG